MMSIPFVCPNDLLCLTLDHLEPMRDKLGPLMLQFGYLNRKISPGGCGIIAPDVLICGCANAHGAGITNRQN